MKKHIKLTIDEQTLAEYDKHYFSIHTKATKRPIAHPYHESINQWMIMKRPMMNALKGKWKDFIVWFIEQQGDANWSLPLISIRTGVTMWIIPAQSLFWTGYAKADLLSMTTAIMSRSSLSRAGLTMSAHAQR